MSKKIELNEEEYKALLNYLGLRPYQEVAGFVQILLSKIKEQVVEEKK